MAMALREDIAEQIKKIKLVDTHEHIRLLPTEDAERGIWALFAGHYLYASLHLAGAPLDAFEQRPSSADQEYEVIAPYLEAVQTTGYFRHVWTSLQAAFGVQESQLSAGLYVDLDQKLRAVQEDPVWIKHLLKEVAGIERALLDTHRTPAQLDMDRELFDPVLRVNAFVMCPWEGLREHNDTSIWDYQDLLSVTVKDFSSFLELFDAMLDRHCRGGARAIKVALAYERSLEFLPVEASLAEQIWNAGPQRATAEQRKALEDFLVFYAVSVRRGIIGCPSRSTRASWRASQDLSSHPGAPLTAGAAALGISGRAVRPISRGLSVRQGASGRGAELAKCLGGHLLGSSGQPHRGGADSGGVHRHYSRQQATVGRRLHPSRQRFGCRRHWSAGGGRGSRA